MFIDLRRAVADFVITTFVRHENMLAHGQTAVVIKTTGGDRDPLFAKPEEAYHTSPSSSVKVTSSYLALVDAQI